MSMDVLGRRPAGTRMLFLNAPLNVTVQILQDVSSQMPSASCRWSQSPETVKIGKVY